MHKKESEKLRWDVLILTTIILIKFMLFLKIGILDTFDGNDMMAINGFDIFKFKVDDWRMPLYPLLFEIFEWIPINVEPKILVIAVQFFGSCITTIIFFKIAKELSDSLIMTSTATVLYALSGGVLGWDKVVSTESLTLSITVIIIYYLIRYTKDKKLKDAGWGCFWTTISVFLRAANLIYVVIITLFFVLQILLYKKEKTEKKKILSYVGIGIAPILVYAVLFYQTFGTFTLTNASINQAFNNVVQSGLYADSENERLVEVIEEERWEEVYINGPEEVKEFVTEVRQKHIIEYAEYLLTIVEDNWSKKFKAPIQWEGATPWAIDYLYNVNWIGFGFGIVIGIFSLALWLYIRILRNRCDWLLLGFAGFILGIYSLADLWYQCRTYKNGK